MGQWAREVGQSRLTCKVVLGRGCGCREEEGTRAKGDQRQIKRIRPSGGVYTTATTDTSHPWSVRRRSFPLQGGKLGRYIQMVRENVNNNGDFL